MHTGRDISAPRRRTAVAGWKGLPSGRTACPRFGNREISRRPAHRRRRTHSPPAPGSCPARRRPAAWACGRSAGRRALVPAPARPQSGCGNACRSAPGGPGWACGFLYCRTPPAPTPEHYRRGGAGHSAAPGRAFWRPAPGRRGCRGKIDDGTTAWITISIRRTPECLTAGRTSGIFRLGEPAERADDSSDFFCAAAGGGAAAAERIRTRRWAGWPSPTTGWRWPSFWPPPPPTCWTATWRGAGSR